MEEDRKLTLLGGRGLSEEKVCALCRHMEGNSEGEKKGLQEKGMKER